MKKTIRYINILISMILMFSGCTSLSENVVEDKNYADAINYASEHYEENGSVDEESETKETQSEYEPEWTVWDGKGEIRKNEQREFAKYQYKDGVAYHIGNIPLSERTSGKVYAERFYMTDDTVYYMQDDYSVDDSPYESKSTNLFAQSINGNGDDVRLLDKNIVYSAYQNGTILTVTKDLVYKEIDAETGDIIYELDSKNDTNVFYRVLYDKSYLIYQEGDSRKYFCYDIDSGKTDGLYIPERFNYILEDWKGNIFSQQSNDDGTVNIVQLYEQGAPVWRIFPNKIPQCYNFSNGKVFYDNGSGEVMEYDLESNEVRKVCDLEPDEYDEDNGRGGRQAFIEAYEDNGGVFLKEMNGYNLYPNVFEYFVDPAGNKTLIGTDFSS